jgi:hypothetical protein
MSAPKVRKALTRHHRRERRDAIPARRLWRRLLAQIERRAAA